MTNKIKTWQERMKESGEYLHTLDEGLNARHGAPMLLAEIAELRAKVESLAADAERYQFLRNCEKDITAENGIPWCIRLIREYGIPTSVCIKGASLDAAIDMAKEKA